MKKFKTFRQVLSLIVLALGLFAVFRYNLGPKLSASLQCSSQPACIKGLSISDNGAFDLAFSADGRYLYGVGVDGSRAWNTEKGYRSRRLFTYSPRAFALAPDGGFAVAKKNGEILLFSAEGEKRLELEPDQSATKNLAFVTGHNLLAIAKGKTLSFWHTQTGKFVTELPHESSITSLAGSSNGIIAAGQANGQIILWPVSDFSAYQVIAASDKMIGELSFSADATVLASADTTGNVFLWDTATLELMSTLKKTESLVTSLSFSAKGELLAVAHYSGNVEVWQTQTESLKASWHYSRNLLSASLSADGSLLAVALADKAELVKTNTRASSSQSRGIGTTLNDSYVRVFPAAILVQDISKITN
ncbi:MAG: hypothetical protein KC422_11550 [Trueperaceae bacterium]|nr:hypothetical protein [Trueperaceae bacterium]